MSKQRQYMCHKQIIAVLVALLLLQATAQVGSVGTITQDITTIQDYSLQQQCVQTCFQMNNDFCPMDLLGIALGCASMGCSSRGWQAKNDCYCRLDFQQPAQDYLDGCISKSCTVGDPSVALGSAASIYQRYCAEKGYDTTAPASVEASTTSVSRATSSTRSQAGPTSTSPTDGNPPTATGGLSTAALVGIILAAVVVLALFAGLTWWYCGRTPRPPAPLPQPHPPPPYVQPLSSDSINRFNYLNEPGFGEAADNPGPHAPHHQIAGPMSIQSGHTNMSQPFGHLGARWN
jgi:hypothetical protein